MSTLIHRRLNIIILNKKVVTSQLVVMARWWGWMDVEHLENEMCHGVMELPSHGHVILLHVTQVWPCMTVIYVSFQTKYAWQPAGQPALNSALYKSGKLLLYPHCLRSQIPDSASQIYSCIVVSNKKVFY